MIDKAQFESLVNGLKAAGFLADAADHIVHGIDAISDALKSER